MVMLTGAGAGDDGQTQSVSCLAENPRQLAVGHAPHRPPLHSLQTIPGSDLPALRCRAAPPDGHKTVGEKGRSWKQEGLKSV